MDKEGIARVAHEVNRGYCEGLGDHSQVPWADAPQWQRDSALAGVAFHVEHPEASAAASHENWLAQKVKEGWVWGPVKNPEKKLHPCVMPFEHLPLAQQCKDRIFRAVVHALAGELDHAGTAEVAP